jgi:hypothetical protein
VKISSSVWSSPMVVHGMNLRLDMEHLLSVGFSVLRRGCPRSPLGYKIFTDHELLELILFVISCCGSRTASETRANDRFPARSWCGVIACRRRMDRRLPFCAKAVAGPPLSGPPGKGRLLNWSVQEGETAIIPPRMTARCKKRRLSAGTVRATSVMASACTPLQLHVVDPVAPSL